VYEVLSTNHFEELAMPNGNDQSNPKDPGSGAGTGTGSGAGAPKGTGGSQDGASPDKVDKPPQTGIVVAAAVGGLIGGLVGAIIGSNLHP
jgi:hypothetical protein